MDILLKVLSEIKEGKRSFHAKGASMKDLEAFHETAESLLAAENRGLVTPLVKIERNTNGRCLIQGIIVNRGLTYDGTKFLQTGGYLTAGVNRQLPWGVITVMFTDIVDSTKLKIQLPHDAPSVRDDVYRQEIKEPHDNLVCKAVAEYEGYVFKTTGDGFGFWFVNPEQAAKCSLGIRENLEKAPIPTPLGDLQLRIGLHTGFVAPTNDGDIISTTADKAARIQAHARPGEILLSLETYVFVRKVTGILLKRIGSHDLKGLGMEEIYSLQGEDIEPFDSAISGESYEHQLTRMFKQSPRQAIRWAYGGVLLISLDNLGAAGRVGGGADADVFFRAGLVSDSERQIILQMGEIAEKAEMDPYFDVSSDEIWRLCKMAVEMSGRFEKTAAQLNEAFYGPRDAG